MTNLIINLNILLLLINGSAIRPELCEHEFLLINKNILSRLVEIFEVEKTMPYKYYGLHSINPERSGDGFKLYFTLFDRDKDEIILNIYNEGQIRKEVFSNPTRIPILGNSGEIIAFSHGGDIIFTDGFTLLNTRLNKDIIFDPSGQVYLINKQNKLSVWKSTQPEPVKLFDVNFDTKWYTWSYKIQSFKNIILIACNENKNGHFYAILIKKYSFNDGEWKAILDKRIRTSHHYVDLRLVDIEPCCRKIAFHEAFFPTFSFRNGIYIYDLETDTLIKQKEWFVEKGLFLHKNIFNGLE